MTKTITVDGVKVVRELHESIGSGDACVVVVLRVPQSLVDTSAGVILSQIEHVRTAFEGPKKPCKGCPD